MYRSRMWNCSPLGAALPLCRSWAVSRSRNRPTTLRRHSEQTVIHFRTQNWCGQKDFINKCWYITCCPSFSFLATQRFVWTWSEPAIKETRKQDWGLQEIRTSKHQCQTTLLQHNLFKLSNSTRLFSERWTKASFKYAVYHLYTAQSPDQTVCLADVSFLSGWRQWTVRPSQCPECAAVLQHSHLLLSGHKVRHYFVILDFRGKSREIWPVF